ncbi:hydrolase [Streptomyces bottropensis ATCC 25435]|uniref:Hydrolase n=1 Tax=Streptomyces bottropensis ATCC 25435 TaxID=1054862 RepID=M3DIK0_9ACTN|nr:hydrolase [Streptomyces bottropensis ATCC 25435]
MPPRRPEHSSQRGWGEKLDIPVLALGGTAFIGDRNEAQMRLFAHDVTGHVFHAGHDLAEEVPDEMADVVLPFLALRT